ATNGCACRSTWYWGSRTWPYASYCSNPDGSSHLWCQVTPTCPTYTIRPYEPCANELTAAYCRSQPIFITTSSRRPKAPNISPMLPSQPPPLAPVPPMDAVSSSHGPVPPMDAVSSSHGAVPPMGLATPMRNYVPPAEVAHPAYGVTPQVVEVEPLAAAGSAGIVPGIDVIPPAVRTLPPGYAVRATGNVASPNVGMPPASAIPTTFLQFKVTWTIDGAASDADLDIMVSWTFDGVIYELTYGTAITRGGRYGGDNRGMSPVPNFETVSWDDISEVLPDPAEYRTCVLCFHDSCGPTYNITLYVTVGSRSGSNVGEEHTKDAASSTRFSTTSAWRVWDTSPYAWGGNLGVHGCDASSPGFLNSFQYPPIA
ncbi:hypothetical protein Vretifemale_9520, partial [Volvox reticuliferus]